MNKSTKTVVQRNNRISPEEKASLKETYREICSELEAEIKRLTPIKEVLDPYKEKRKYKQVTKCLFGLKSYKRKLEKTIKP